MIARDPLMDVLILDTHEVISRVDVLSKGITISSGLLVSDGQVTKDRGQWSRRTCTVTVADSSLAPRKAGDLLAPYGNEIRVWRGIRAGGNEFLLCQGTFGIQDSELDYLNGGVKLTGIDRGRRVSDGRFAFARTFGASSVLSILRTLIVEATPWANVSISPGLVDQSTAQLTWEQDREAACKDLAGSLGGECFTEPFGDFVVAPVPDPAATPVWTVRAGNGGALVAPSRKLSRQGVYNAVVAKSSAVTGGAVASSKLPDGRTAIGDDDPYSPTYRAGGFGEAVAFYDSPFITDEAQANTAAAAVLRNQLGLSRSVSFESVVNPALEAGDVIAVDYGDGLVERHVLDRVVLPLGPGSMRCDTRTTTYQLSV